MKTLIVLLPTIFACAVGTVDEKQGVPAPTSFCIAVGVNDKPPIPCECGSSTAPTTCGIAATVDDDGGITYTCCQGGTGQCNGGVCQ